MPYYVHIPSKEVAKRPTLLAIEPRDLEGVYKKKHWRASSYGAIGAEVKAPKARFYADGRFLLGFLVGVTVLMLDSS